MITKFVDRSCISKLTDWTRLFTVQMILTLFLSMKAKFLRCVVAQVQQLFLQCRCELLVQ